jgi:2,4-diketo-3-deoxy-L-fuconate hydrolase
MTLEPGDLLNTGTPQGVALSGRLPHLAVGDILGLGVGAWGVSAPKSSKRGAEL